jgi:hypothetical protein
MSNLSACLLLLLPLESRERAAADFQAALRLVSYEDPEGWPKYSPSLVRYAAELGE